MFLIMNLTRHSFIKKKDLCDVCEQFKNANAEEKCTQHASFDEHLQNKIASRLEKEKQRVVSENSAEICAVFDLQKVLPLPAGDMSSLYYKRKLSLFNFTIFNMGKQTMPLLHVA